MSLRGLGESKRHMIKDGNPVKVMYIMMCIMCCMSV